jgi:hypothetical protein
MRLVFSVLLPGFIALVAALHRNAPESGKAVAPGSAENAACDGDALSSPHRLFDAVGPIRDAAPLCRLRGDVVRRYRLFAGRPAPRIEPNEFASVCAVTHGSSRRAVTVTLIWHVRLLI